MDWHSVSRIAYSNNEAKIVEQVWKQTIFQEKIHAIFDEWYADVYGAFRVNYGVGYGGFGHPSVLVYLFQSRAFQVVEFAYCGAGH